MSIRAVRGPARDGGFIVRGGIHVTRRELEALMLVAAGMSNAEAAENLGVKRPQTIRNYLHGVVKKLGARSRAHAVVVAVQNRMLEIELEKSVVELTSADYTLCLFCNRAFRWEKIRLEEAEPFVVNRVRYEPPPTLLCEYEDCDGWATYGWPWDVVRKEHPEYPKIPEHGVVYRMTGKPMGLR